MIESVVWSVSMVLMAALVALFAWVGWSGRVAAEDAGTAVAAAYRWRPWLIGVALLIVIGANAKTLGQLPYIAHAVAAAPGAVQRVDVVGEQWDWTITPSTVAAGTPVEFHVTSRDVNHGFALYDPSLRIVAQTQAMPGYDNVLRYTFPQAGATYQVMCLEYCGLVHHEMASEIKVVGH